MAELTEAPPASAGDLLRRAARFAPDSWNAEARTIEVVWTTGADVSRFDYWEGRRYIERLVVTDEAVDMTRLNSGAAPVLDSHSAWSLDSQIGVVERAWIENGVGRAVLRLSEREDVQPVVRDIASGVIRNISVGYSYERDKIRVTPDLTGGPELRELLRWQPYEISFVTVPADAGAGTRAMPAPGGASLPTPPAPPADTQETRMSGSTTPGQPPATTTPPAPTLDAEAIRAQAQQDERARVVAITGAARALGQETMLDALISEGLSLEAAQTRMISAMAERQQERPQPSHIRVLADEGEVKLAAMGEALLHRAGHLVDEQGRPAALPERAREFRGFRMLEFAGECITLRGGKVRGLTPAEIARAALGQREYMSRAGLHSVSDFPNLLSNTASNAMGKGYGSTRRTFTTWARRRTLPDFKDFRVVQLSGAPTLDQISATGKDAGEIQFGTIGEGAESYRLARFGKRIAITFEAIVNDDMDGFGRVPQMFGVSATRLESTVMYGILNSNPNMSDGNALFGTAHVNTFGNGVAGFSSGDGVLNLTGLANGRRVMRTQMAPNGDIIDVVPSVLVVPPALETAALQYTSQAFQATVQGSINPYANQLTPVVEPRLVSATQWYLFASPDEIDTAEYGYLEGMDTPQISSYTDEDTDGVIIKCTHSFGGKATEWRGMARSTGT